ncbi:ribonuclease E activity regulator RraA [Glaciecola sp. 2405UD65-10]|jgi:regulator of ribonuclease activity A|uniref:ribonuclease E activity regulator RraA n=1 Tax=Glaciecola sp. 2405UD65-10 TaxID=3397244 RepID=UPI003B5A0959
MECNTSELCDMFAENIDVVDPVFSSFGARLSYSGEVTTVKCFEDRGLVDKILATNGLGKVLLIDGGGSLRRAILDADSVQLAIENDWEGIICFGALRDIDLLEEMDIGIHALGAIPVSAESREIGDLDIAVNFGGVTFLPEDFVYADSTGIVLSGEALDVD